MDDAALKNLLAALAQAGDSVNLYQVAEGAGLERDQAQDMGTQLMADGLLEMVSLSGSVRVTEAGRLLLGGAASGAEDSLEAFVKDLEAARLSLGGREAADLAADLACLKAQLTRSAPLGAVVGACLEAMAQNLEHDGSPQASALVVRAKALA